MFNTIRGDLGEYIIYETLKSRLSSKHYSTRRDGDVCDFQIGNIWIEVKTSSYIQAWEQSGKPHSDIVFDIAEREDYDFVTGKPIKGVKKRWANIYVLCLLAEKDRGTVNPLNTDQWKFWIVSTSELNRVRKHSSRLPLNQLNTVNAIESNLNNLFVDIEKTYNLHLKRLAASSP
ncbi:hypothetical protein SAMN05216214_1251 [Atopomonas hussainii]|uniref:Uncharacterized protein n=1 Tax=Atopomonas hussainii TaxID=1429083 RepID=A0A1H7TAV0_9GAMM|nr:hypothetical protein [Atopomonas hussainii]SEL80957.1 hypothetical protein SAMN05216214_1251 [Atopomonas hussainii]